ncbi:MAG: phosphotransferase [Pseudomonadota bacterium]|nr:phosphotransferase [Pseudomonadota bacterium]
MTEMKDDLLNWALMQGSSLGFKDIESLQPLREQASLRHYFRFQTDTGTIIGVMSEPSSKQNELFEIHSNFLRKNGIRVPKVEAFDHLKGFMILEDFGDKVVQLEINEENKEFLFKKSLQKIHQLQEIKPPDDLLKLTPKMLKQQMYLFEDWFLTSFLELDYSTNDKKMLNDSWDLIVKECSQQSHVICHFDFEFRNLMLLEKNEIGILDFQDLCLGPYAIDLVSILKDIENPLSHEDLLNYLKFYKEGIKGNKLEELKLSDLENDLDFAGFQRQFRILGTLSRLHLRDKKSFRLKDLKQTLKYLQTDLEKYPALKELATFLTEKVEPKLIKILRNIP